MISVLARVLCALVSSVLELTHALPRRGDADHTPTAPQPDAAGRVLHLHRGGTSVVVDLDAVPHPAIVHWGEELTGSSEQTLRGLAVAARPQRVSGGLDEPARATLVRDAGGRLARHPRPRGTPRRRLVQRPAGARRRPGRRPPGAAVARRPRGPAQRAAGAARRHQRAPPPAHHAAQRRRLPLHRPAPAPRVPRAVGRHRDPRHHRPSPAGALAAAAPLRLRDAPAREPPRPARRGRHPVLAAGRPGFGFERGRVHAVHVAWSGNHRLVAERSVSGRGVPRGRRAVRPRRGRPRARRVAHVAGGHRVVGRRAQRARPPLPRRVARAAPPILAGRGRSPSTRGRRSTSTTRSSG